MLNTNWTQHRTDFQKFLPHLGRTFHWNALTSTTRSIVDHPGVTSCWAKAKCTRRTLFPALLAKWKVQNAPTHGRMRSTLMLQTLPAMKQKTSKNCNIVPCSDQVIPSSTTVLFRSGLLSDPIQYLKPQWFNGSGNSKHVQVNQRLLCSLPVSSSVFQNRLLEENDRLTGDEALTIWFSDCANPSAHPTTMVAKP